MDLTRFARNDHWDYRALDSLRSESDHEGALLAIAEAIVGDTSFEYDVVTYAVGDVDRDSYRHYSGSYYPTYGYGYPYYYPRCWGCYD